MADSQPDHEKHGLTTHFYSVTDLNELERLMLVIASDKHRTNNILNLPGFLEDMVVHMIHYLLISRYPTVSEAHRNRKLLNTVDIANMVRMNNLFGRPLDQDIDKLIERNDLVIQEFAEAAKAYAILIVETAKETRDAQPVGNNANAEPPEPTTTEE